MRDSCVRASFLCLAMALSVPALGLVAQPSPNRVQSFIPLGRLPQSVFPTHYDVEWRIDPAAPRFSGRVRIDIEVTKATNRIWLHAKDLEVGELQVTDAGGGSVRATFRQLHQSGVARIGLARNLSPQRIRVEMSFTGLLNSQLQGLYSIHYRNRTYVLTQFEATSARLALPCFDEPSFKTPFDIGVTIPSSLQAISNAPEARSEADGSGFKTIHFATTEKLPTYLLALAVGNFETVHGRSVPANGGANPAPVRAVRLAGDDARIDSVVESTANLTIGLAAYLDVPYPFQKLDVLVAPDFAGSGMENAGAVFYRESDLLVPVDGSSEKRRFSKVLQAHELAHQWFGNLVTPIWWSDLWLKEGFASFLSYRAADGWSRRAEYDRLYRLNTLAGMEVDALASALPARRQVSTTEDIDAAYDAVAYNKSAALLGMYENYMGEERFRDMVRGFLRDHAYGNASSADFAGALGKAADNDSLEKSFEGFLDQPGIPEIQADWTCGPADGAHVSLRQHRYLPLGSTALREIQWRVPICLSYEEQSAPASKCTLLEHESATMEMPAGACATLFPNAGGRGYYRWVVGTDRWEGLLRRASVLDFGEALSLADSVGAAFRSGKINAVEMLHAADLLATSKYPEVALFPVRDVLFIRDFVVRPDLRHDIDARLEANYLKAARHLLSPVTESPAWQQAAAGFLALEVGTAEIREYFAAMGAAAVDFVKHDSEPKVEPSGEMRSVALAAAARQYGTPYIHHLIARLAATSSAAQRGELLQALAWAPANNGLEEVTALLTQSSISDTEAYELLLALGRQPEARRKLLYAVSRRFPALVKRLPTDRQGAIPFIVSGGYQARTDGSFRAGLCSGSHLREFVGVFAPLVSRLSGGARFFDNAVEQIRLCTRLAQGAKRVVLDHPIGRLSVAASGTVEGRR